MQATHVQRAKPLLRNEVVEDRQVAVDSRGHQASEVLVLFAAAVQPKHGHREVDGVAVVDPASRWVVCLCGVILVRKVVVRVTVVVEVTVCRMLPRVVRVRWGGVDDGRMTRCDHNIGAVATPTTTMIRRTKARAKAKTKRKRKQQRHCGHEHQQRFALTALLSLTSPTPDTRE